MFYCIGENEGNASYSGKGNTIEEAIQNWAYNSDMSDIIHEFNKYCPTIIQGEIVEIELIVSIKANRTN